MDDFNEFVGTEFSRLLLRGSDLDWARLALELAADGQPQLDPGRTLRWISERRDELLGVVAAAWSESDALRRLAACLVERHGIEGHSSAVRSADGYYLNRIIETGRGAPIGLSLLYLAVARSLMMELHPVAAPIRFLTRYESTEGPTFVDPYDRGRLMSFDECIGWCAEFGDRDELGRWLEPVSPRVAILHMLNRLKILHVEREDWQTAWRVQRRLAALKPTSYGERRDLAILAAKAGQLPQAVELLRHCLKEGPSKDTPLLTSYLQTVELQLASWN